VVSLDIRCPPPTESPRKTADSGKSAVKENHFFFQNCGGVNPPWPPPPPLETVAPGEKVQLKQNTKTKRGLEDVAHNVCGIVK